MHRWFICVLTYSSKFCSNISATQIEQISGGVKPHQVIGDLLDDSLTKRLIDETIGKFSRLDFLVNNAGGAPIGTLADPNLLREFDQVIKLNVRSVVELTQLAVPRLEKTKGNITNISSVAGISPFTLVYSTSKAALDMVTKTSDLGLGSKGIRVNLINPGPVITAFGRSMGFNDQNAVEKMMKSMIPDSLLGRIGEPYDIANLASFLASDDASNITGSIYVSDSGMLLKPLNFSRENLETNLGGASK